MPGRDSVLSRHHPASFDSRPSPSHRSLLPPPGNPPPEGIHTPSSSMFNVRTFPLRVAATPPESPDSTDQTAFAARRPPISEEQWRTNGFTVEDDGGPSYQLGRSRKRSQDITNEHRFGFTPSTSLSTSSQAIRDSSNRLASLSFSHPRRDSTASDSSVHPVQDASLLLSSDRLQRNVGDHQRIHPRHSADAVKADGLTAVREFVPIHQENVGRSGLSMMMNREGAERQRIPQTSDESTSTDSSIPEVDEESLASPQGIECTGLKDLPDEASGEATPMPRKDSNLPAESDEDEANSSSALRRYLASEVEREDVERATERTPLTGRVAGKEPFAMRSTWSNLKQRAGKITGRSVISSCLKEPVKTLPSVVLGVLLNVLDGVSYGMILFPASPIFRDFGSFGVSMFFMSCVVSQLVFSLGGSIFAGGNGSMMIEAVPFFHILINIIQAEIGDDTTSIVATTMVAFAFSSILTGLVFFALGALRLGSFIGYFPRHILVGCIGGVGIFLIETGLEVSRGLKNEAFEYNSDNLKLFFQSPHAILLWTIPLTLAIILRIITHFYRHQLVFPIYFFVIPFVFYIVVSIGGWDLKDLRGKGWVFDVGQSSQAWWKFYTYFDFKRTSWRAFWAAMPTQLALVFFGILHVPLNIPALGVSLREDSVKLNRELVGHGVSNLAAGLAGTVPNYLTYVNTVLFYRVGGGSRLSGIMLALATAGVMFVGPAAIGYIPVMVVGALIFVLGIDLTIEAVWDTRNRMNRLEYLTIWAIAIGMTVWDFVIGLLFGIILACVFFVVQSSRGKAIRTVFNGATYKSTVRRPKSQRAFIQQVGSQTYVMKLQGFLFFGTISAVEDEIRKLLDLAEWEDKPIRFLIIDFSLVHGLDFSSAEAFVRVQRLLAAKDVLLILCGVSTTGLVGTALQGVDLWADREGIRLEVFAGLNDALEWTENAYLIAFYGSQNAVIAHSSAEGIDFPKILKPPFSFAESFQNSPRRIHLAKAGDDTLPRHSAYDEPTSSQSDLAQPLQILLQTLGAYCDEPLGFFRDLSPFFAELFVPSGTILWRQKDRADGLYVIQSGSLRATYSYDDHRELVQETMMAGTIAGDLSTLSGTIRNATVVAERECVLWKMNTEGLERLEREKQAVAQRFIRIVLKAVAEEQDVLSSHLIAALS